MSGFQPVEWFRRKRDLRRLGVDPDATLGELVIDGELTRRRLLLNEDAAAAAVKIRGVAAERRVSFAAAARIYYDEMVEGEETDGVTDDRPEGDRPDGEPA